VYALDRVTEKEKEVMGRTNGVLSFDTTRNRIEKEILKGEYTDTDRIGNRKIRGMQRQKARCFHTQTD
jgi:hypothetical protein